MGLWRCRSTSVLTSSVRFGICRAASRGDVRINVFVDVECGNCLRNVVHEIACDRTSTIRHCQAFICDSVSPLYRLYVGYVFRYRVPTSIYVFSVRADDDLVGVSLCSVSIRASIRRRTAFRIRLVPCFGRTGIKAIGHLLRNDRDVNVVNRTGGYRACAIIYGALICFRLVCGQALGDGICVFLIFCRYCRDDVFFCCSKGRGSVCCL